MDYLAAAAFYDLGSGLRWDQRGLFTTKMTDQLGG